MNTRPNDDVSSGVRPEESRRIWVGIVLALVLPTAVTLVYFVLLAETKSSVQQSVYSAGKTVQFLLPVAWTWWILKQGRPRFPLAPRGMVPGLVFGVGVIVAMFALEELWLSRSAFAAGLESEARLKVTQLGLNEAWKYIGVGLFYAVVHSGLEEYYWRWFVYGQLRHVVSEATAIVFSSLGFMAHHVILLGVYFGWDSPLAYVFSLGVAVGGGFWAWLYGRTESLLSPWVSHLLVDAGIFALGYGMVRTVWS